jgi:hypothetical protein
MQAYRRVTQSSGAFYWEPLKIDFNREGREEREENNARKIHYSMVC